METSALVIQGYLDAEHGAVLTVALETGGFEPNVIDSSITTLSGLKSAFGKILIVELYDDNGRQRVRVKV